MYTHAGAIRRLHEIRARMGIIAEYEHPSDEDDQEFRRLAAEFEDVDSTRLSLERQALLGRVRNGRDAINDPQYLRTEHGAGGESDQHSARYNGRDGIAGRALRRIDEMERRGSLTADAASRAAVLVDAGPARSRSVAAHWIDVAGSDAYLRAFASVVADPERGSHLWDDTERAAVRAVQEFRAASLNDTSGGFLVPVTLDPAIILTSGGSRSTLRENANVVTIATDVWRGVSSAGVQTHWHGEAQEMEDDTPALAGPEIPVHRLDSFIPFSFEIGQDAVAFTQQMTALLVDAAAQATNAAYTVGTGSGQPVGVITALAGSPSIVTPTTPEVFAPADVYKVQAALPPRWSDNARWYANLNIINIAAQWESTNGARVFPGIEGSPRSLAGKPLDELSTMDGTFNPAATEANHVLLYGDLRSAFTIVDRIGTTIELVPHLFGPNRRPTGQRGLIMWLRTGSDVVNENAVRLLNLATTA